MSEANCYRCGSFFTRREKEKVCPKCRRPRVRTKPTPEAPLTLREKQIAGLIVQGKLNKEIAWDLRLQEGSVKQYLHVILRKMQVTNRTQLAVKWSHAAAAE